MLKLLFLLASCTTDFDGPSGTPGANDPVPLLVKNITLEESAVATRAATAPAVGSSIGVFRQTDSYYTTASNNIKYTLSTDKGWQPATAGTDILLGSNDSRALLYAYHPAGDKIAVKADNVTIDLAARAYDAGYDLSYVPAGQAQALDVGGLVYNFHPGVNFTMRRAYTQLGVDLTRGDDYGGAGAVTAVSLTVNGGGKLYSGGTQNIATGAYTAGTADINKITYTVPADTKITPAAKTASFRHLLPPGKSGAISDLTLTATVDGMTTRTTISAAGLDLKAGTRYVVKATFNYNGLAATIKTTDWDSQTAWKEDVAFVPEIPPIDIGLPFVIAPGNLRAVKPAGSNTYEYFFAEEQGYYSGVLGSAYNPAGGDYFCWNTLDPSEIVKKDFMNIEWDDAFDPCRKIDTGEWYTPSSAQLRSIIEKGDVLWGTYTMRGGTPIEGMYFGATVIPSKASQNKYLFLPAAGFRNNTGLITNYEAYCGFYWSTTRSSIEAENPFGLSFKNVSNSAYTGTGAKAFADTGMPVRCVKDKPKPKPAHAIDLEGLDFYVADGNVVATKQADNTYKYDFAEEQGYYSGVNGAVYDPSGGDYFCWNELDPAATSSSNTTDVWDDNSDPCRKIGDGQWYTPTQAQLRALIDAGYVWDDNAYTTKDGTKPGMYFGTSDISIAKADQDKYVFLPAAGNRGGTNWSLVSTYGYYWSSTTGNISTAYDLYFNGGDCSMYYAGRYFGCSVRCVRDK